MFTYVKFIKSLGKYKHTYFCMCNEFTFKRCVIVNAITHCVGDSRKWMICIKYHTHLEIITHGLKSLSLL